MTRNTRLTLFAFVVGVVIALIAGIVYVRKVGIVGGKVQRQIAADLKARDMPPDAPWRDRRTQSLLRAFYKKRHMQPAWTTGAGPNAQARDLAEVLAHADREGLVPADYSTVPLKAALEKHEKTSVEKMDARPLAEFDLLCSIAALHYMSDVYDGRINPRALDAVWVAHPRKGDLNVVLQEALERNRVKDALEDLPPTHEGYRALRDARARYEEIVKAGGWDEIPPGPALRKGARGVRVRALRARLAATGDLGKGDARGDVFDGRVEAAVKKYQQRFGRAPDGVVGEAEMDELNVSAETRLRQIELNMERWRWLPKSFGERHLVVNIPEYMLHLYDGKSVLDMRVVVGKAMNQTPVFSDTMTQVVINPTWSVPTSIVVNEIAPAMAEDPSYLANHHMRLLDGTGPDAKEIDPSGIDWGDTTEERHLAVRQDAGEGNALGAIKFLFPNSFDVYLHDTPAGELFAREERSFSHGCIRVEFPLVLANRVLAGSPEADTTRLRELITTGETRTLKVPHPLPVNIVYFTAFADEDGMVGFRDDVYGIDADLVDQLRGRAHAQAVSRAQAHSRAVRASTLARPARRH